MKLKGKHARCLVLYQALLSAQLMFMNFKVKNLSPSTWFCDGKAGGAEWKCCQASCSLPDPTPSACISPSEVYGCAAWNNRPTSCLLMVDGKIRSFRQNQCMTSLTLLLWKIKVSAEQGSGLVMHQFIFWYLICRLAPGQRPHFEETVLEKSDPMSPAKGISRSAKFGGKYRMSSIFLGVWYPLSVY